MRNRQEMLEWYRTHQSASQIGFNPDGRCLQVVRTARDIAAMYPSAKALQDAVPREHRFYNVADLRQGMALFFDDPNDSNTFGHIVTQIGRVKGADRSSLDDILVETNSVVSGELVVVRASYFAQHWGDSFQFGTDWINGQVVDYFQPRPPKPAGPTRVDNFRETRPEWDVKILDRAIQNGRSDLRPFVRDIEAAVNSLPEDKEDTKVREFVETFKRHRVLKTRLLDQAVADGRVGEVRGARTTINMVLKRLPLH